LLSSTTKNLFLETTTDGRFLDFPKLFIIKSFTGSRGGFSKEPLVIEDNQE